MQRLRVARLSSGPDYGVRCWGVLQCARQIKDAHREAKELVAAESARCGASSPQEDQPDVAATQVPGSDSLQQPDSSAQQGSSPVADHAAANGVASKSSASHTGTNMPVSGNGSTQAAGGSAAEKAERSSMQETCTVGGAVGLAAADRLSSAGGQAIEEEGSRGGFVEYETDELSPLEAEVATAAEMVELSQIRKMWIL